jgi:hypothetical protein
LDLSTLITHFADHLRYSLVDCIAFPNILGHTARVWVQDGCSTVVILPESLSMRNRDVFGGQAIAIGCAFVGLCGSASGQVAAPAESSESSVVPFLGNTHPELSTNLTGQGAMDTMRLVLHPSTRTVTVGGSYNRRDNCPSPVTYTDASFSSGTYTAQGGFAEGEIAATSYTLPSNAFPVHIVQIEMIFAQQAAVVQTTTQYSVLIYDGLPTDPQPAGFPIIYSSSTNPGDAPPLIMPPGTRGTNIQVSIDPQDPEQIYVYNTNGNSTFSVGFRVDHHNSQTANPCTTEPTANRNAFPVTDNTAIGCGSGYAALNYPNFNWLYAVDCGPNGCPPNGGWTRFSSLQADTTLPFPPPFNLCVLGCRPRGDWVIRVTYDPFVCPPPEGACCFGTSGCAVMTQTLCAGTGAGVWRGPGTTCGTFSGGAWSGCVTPPNQPPVANAGADQTVNDNDHNGVETVVVNGNQSSDPDGFISAYRWSEGATVIQDGPAFLSHDFPVGAHTLTLRVTDNQGAIATDTMTVTVVAPCVADFDNGSGTGTPDGGVGIEDLLYYLFIYDEGSVAADVDDGTATGVRDGGVGIEDLLYYLTRYDAGC